MKNFEVQYEKDGKQYGRTVKAKDWDEAEAKAKKTGLKGAKVTGEIIHSEKTDLDKKLKSV